MNVAKPKSFQEIVLRLQNYWSDNGCAILQPYDMEVGAGTFHPATTLRSLGENHWAAAYVSRPEDQAMEDMAKILIDCNIIINFRSS